MQKFNIIAAISKNSGLGFKNRLPWKKFEIDMKHFEKITKWNYITNSSPFLNHSLLYNSHTEYYPVCTHKINAVIMGRSTWDSIPEDKRPLKQRINIILDNKAKNNMNLNHQEVFLNSWMKVWEYISKFKKDINDIFMIGGEQIFKYAIENAEFCQRIYLTRIWKDYECDKFFPNIPEHLFKLSHISKTYKENETSLDFAFYSNSFKINDNLFDPYLLSLYPPSEELQYLNLIKYILKFGTRKQNRTGVDTISIFGHTMRFDLSNSYPLLTTKRVFFRGVVEELLWFFKGSTNAKLLSVKGIHIWDENSSRDFLDKLGFQEREEGDLGPVYGFQWRHFGANYTNMHEDYKGKGIDQIHTIINTLKENPNDRRIILSAWNPIDIKKMALPPCHILCQFNVSNNKLSCQLYQRSCDVGLGVPFNIASYSLLTHILAKLSGLDVGELVYVLGDAHIYYNHIDPLIEQAKKTPNPFPQIKINKVINSIDDVEQMEFKDFELLFYQDQGIVKMKMAR